MSSLAELTDAYYDQPQTIDSLPVEPLVLPDLNTGDVTLGDGNSPTRITVRPEPEPVRPEPEIKPLLHDFNTSVGTKLDDILNSLTGSAGKPRYQLWPEKVVREGLSAAGDVMKEGTVNPGLRREDFTDIPSPDMPTNDSTWLGKLLNIAPVGSSPADPLIEKAQAISALAGSGGLAGTTDATLGATPFLRPALKYKDRLYKGKEGQQHQDVIPKELYPEFEQMAMNGEDISHYNFGFVNEKGQFLTRDKALEYAINTGLVDPQAGKFGALTSTLMADSSKPGTAIEAMAKTYPLAKPADRWSNTLGQNDNLIQNMTPDEFLKKSRPLKIDAESRETINGLKQHIKEGKTLDPLELHLNGKEDGRHRAIAAKELGIKEVPVLNFRPVEKAPAFYSAVEHQVNSIPQSKMTGDQWLGTLSNKPGVKPEELQWTGLGEFLKENAGKPVTKEQIQEHLASNKVELKEVNKGKGELDKAVTAFEKETGNGVIVNGEKVYSNEIMPWLLNGDLKVSELPINLQPLAKDILREHSNVEPTKYHSYQLPGGSNYREMLLTLPKKAEVANERYIKLTDELKTKYGDRPWGQMPLTPSERARLDKYMSDYGDGPTAEAAYKSSHWDEPNILAHVRMNDRTIDGKKSLHLEEIQSDWHQQGRDKGYNLPDSKPKNVVVKKAPEGENGYVVEVDGRPMVATGTLERANVRANELRDTVIKGSGVPDAPFKKSWHELALKRMIREAAETSHKSEVAHWENMVQSKPDELAHKLVASGHLKEICD